MTKSWRKRFDHDTSSMPAGTRIKGVMRELLRPGVTSNGMTNQDGFANEIWPALFFLAVFGFLGALVGRWFGYSVPLGVLALLGLLGLPFVVMVAIGLVSELSNHFRP